MKIEPGFEESGTQDFRRAVDLRRDVGIVRNVLNARNLASIKSISRNEDSQYCSTTWERRVERAKEVAARRLSTCNNV